MDAQSSPLALNFDNERVTVLSVYTCPTDGCKGGLPPSMAENTFVPFPPTCQLCGQMYRGEIFTAEDLNWETPPLPNSPFGE